MKADRERSEDRVAVAFRTAVERLVDMFEAGAQRNPVTRKKCMLGRAAGEGLESGQPVRGGKLANRVHALVDIHR